MKKPKEISALLAIVTFLLLVMLPVSKASAQTQAQIDADQAAQAQIGLMQALKEVGATPVTDAQLRALKKKKEQEAKVVLPDLLQSSVDDLKRSGWDCGLVLRAVEAVKVSADNGHVNSGALFYAADNSPNYTDDQKIQLNKMITAIYDQRHVRRLPLLHRVNTYCMTGE